MSGVTASVPLLEHELVGPPGAPVVLALGGISASRQVARSADGATPGWWEAVVGPGKPIDTTARRVLGVEYLDGESGEDGLPLHIVSTHDQARAIVALLDATGIDQVDAAVGASYGGMVALALAEQWPERVGRVVAISAAHESQPMSTAIRALQRRIVHLGIESGRANDAMVLARALAMTTYRTAEEFAQRFDVEPVVAGADAHFAVEEYLLHAGEKFAARLAPSRFLALSLSADLHRVEPERITVPVTVVAAEGDTLVPRVQTNELARRLPRLRGHVTLHSRVGHDAFLVEPQRLGTILTSALGS